MTDAYNSSPIGPLFVAATIHAEMLDRESPARYPDFASWLGRAHYLANQWKEAEPDNGEPEFILGAAEGYDAVYESRWGGWFAALTKGLRSRNRFVAALEKDSTLTDALIGVGNYDYWKADRTDFINWLPIIPDNRLKGLAELQLVADSGLLCQAAARGSLVWALMNEGLFDQALTQADLLAALAPDGKAALWMKAQANYRLYRWDSAIAIYLQLDKQIEAEGAGNYFNLIECSYNEAQCHFGAGRYIESAEACHRGLSYPADRDTRRRQMKKLEDMRDLQKRLKKLLAKS
jgi:tetratricopeptide (TPR) repeat protein